MKISCTCASPPREFLPGGLGRNDEAYIPATLKTFKIFIDKRNYFGLSYGAAIRLIVCCQAIFNRFGRKPAVATQQRKGMAPAVPALEEAVGCGAVTGGRARVVGFARWPWGLRRLANRRHGPPPRFFARMGTRHSHPRGLYLPEGITTRKLKVTHTFIEAPPAELYPRTRH